MGDVTDIDAKTITILDKNSEEYSVDLLTATDYFTVENNQIIKSKRTEIDETSRVFIIYVNDGTDFEARLVFVFPNENAVDSE